MLKAWFLCLLLLSPNLWAMTLKPEQTQMRVSSEPFPAMSQESVRIALHRLLVDLTAQKDWLETVDMQFELNASVGYVSSHAIDYSTQPPSVDYQFDSSKVQALIESQSMFVWPKPRPSVLVWAMDESKRRFQPWTAIESSELPKLRNELGIELMSPMLDLKEQQLAREALIWAGETQPIIQQAQKYSTDYVVIAEGANENWRLTVYREYEVVWAGTDWAEFGGFLYQNAQKQASTETVLNLELTQIQSWDAYQSVIATLESNPWWVSTDIRHISPVSVHLTLTVRGSRFAWIRQQLSESGLVWENPDQPLAQRLIFAWNPN